MRVLFNDALQEATFSSVNASPNYPARSLGDIFLRVRYQVNAASDGLTVTLDSPATIDSIYLGYIGGVTGIDVELFVGGVGQGSTTYFSTYTGEEFAVAHFDAVDNVDSIVFSFNGTDPFYIGGIAAGQAIEMPAPDAAWDDSLTDNSLVTRSLHGQVQQQYIEPLMRYLFTFNGIDSDEFLAIKHAAMALGKKPGWVTLFEESVDDFPPGYYSVELGSLQRDRRAYRFTLTLEEAR